MLDDLVKTLPEINDLGRRYAELPLESDEKQAFLLEICQCFHLGGHPKPASRGHLKTGQLKR